MVLGVACAFLRFNTFLGKPKLEDNLFLGFVFITFNSFNFSFPFLPPSDRFVWQSPCFVVDVTMSSFRSLPVSPDLPSRGQSIWDLGLRPNSARLEAFLRKLEDIHVVDSASEARLRRACEAVDADVSPNGRNLVFYLCMFKKTRVIDLKRVLSLGARPDVPDSKGTLPSDAAMSAKKFKTVETLALWAGVCAPRKSGSPESRTL